MQPGSDDQAAQSPFGVRLATLRRAAGLTQEDLARVAGLSTRGISNLERGVRRRPHRHTVQSIADGLGLSQDVRKELDRLSRSTSGPVAGAAQSQPAGGPSPLIGRDSQGQAVANFLAGGNPPVLLFCGPPGIGKTRLLDFAARSADRRGLAVVSARFRPAAGQPPLAAVAEALAGVASAMDRARLAESLAESPWLLRLLPELATQGRPVPGPAPTDQDRRLLFAAVGHFLARLGGRAGTVLIIDDLQWCDADTVDLLTELARQTEPRVLVLGAFRGTELVDDRPLSGLVADLADRALVAVREVGPLPARDARRLVDLASDARLDPGRRERVVARAGGVPAFLVGCAGGATNENAPGRDALPRCLAQSVRRRVAAQPEAAVALLVAVAAARRPVTVEVLGRVLGMAESEVVAAAEAASRAALLEETPYGYRFVQDVVAEVVDEGLSSARRSMVLRRLAAACGHPVPQGVADLRRLGPGPTDPARALTTEPVV
jgi:transcriptional regulator with XRE-family HTH domain